MDVDGFLVRRGHISSCVRPDRAAHHLFTGRLDAENGQIKLIREGLNTVAAASLLLAGDVHDLPANLEAAPWRYLPVQEGARHNSEAGAANAMHLAA